MNHIYGSGYMYLCASYYQGNYLNVNTGSLIGESVGTL